MPFSHLPVLVLAPHLIYPLRSGADILIHHRWSAFSRFVPYVDVIGQDSITRFADGELLSTQKYRNKARTKFKAALRTILYGSHYLREKFVTPEFIAQANKYMNHPSYGWIVGSFTYTVPLLLKDPYRNDRCHLVETHNDDVKWYRTLRESTINPLAKLVASLSERWTVHSVRAHWHHFTFLHVTDADWQGFQRIAPHHRSLHAPIGVHVPETIPVAQPSTATIHLLFVGSLGVIVNGDALNNFAGRYYPVLKQYYGNALHVDIVGSSPTKRVKALCEDNGWTLHADASDSTLQSLYHQANFSMLPFQYATGAKLKLLESLAYGVPFLATPQVQGYFDAAPPLCLFSDDPSEWLGHIRSAMASEHSKSNRLALIDTAREFSWESTTRKVFQSLENA